MAARKTKGELVTLRKFIENCKEKGEQVIPKTHAVYAYAQALGISPEMIAVAWFMFKDNYVHTDKKYVQWRKTFLRSVKLRYYKLWYFDGTGKAQWTQTGIQARLAMKAEKNGQN